MTPRNVFARVAGFAVRRPVLVLVAVVVLAVAGTVAALRLSTDAGIDTLVDRDSAEFEASDRFRDRFGDDAVVILVKGNLRNLVLTQNLGTLLELEGCVAGGTPVSTTLPRRKKPLPAVCDEIAELRPARVVYGPATFLHQSVAQIEQVFRGQVQSAQETASLAGKRARNQAAEQGLSTEEQEQAANDAAQAVMQGFQGQLLQLASQYSLTSVPAIDDPQFVSRVVFDISQPAGTPKARFGFLFPNSESALISLRLRPDLDEEQRGRAIELLRGAIDDPRFKLDEGSYVLTGAPVVIDGLADTLQSQLFILLGAAILVMALTLAIVFTPPVRLLPLAVALAAGGLCFGLLSVFGGSLTMASIAVLPVLIGLAVDYAIQFQARFNEARSEGADPEAAAVAAAARGGPTIATACLATAVGFLVFMLSPVPMVRAFGLLLSAGILLAFAVALTGALASLALAARRPPRTPRPVSALGRRVAATRARAAASLERVGKNALAIAIASPGRVLAAALVLAVTGWIAGTRTEVISDIRELAPADLREVNDLEDLQDRTGVSGELNVSVRAGDLTDPELINWMRGFEDRVLERHGFSGESPRCADADLCPGVSLTQLFSDQGEQTSERARALLGAIPPYFSQAVITRNPLTGGIGDTANISFGIPVQPLDSQQRLIDDIRDQIAPSGEPGPPEGTEVELAGVPVLAAEANADLSASRYWLPLAALVAVGLVLALVYRSARRALVPLLPIVLATGWSALVVAAIDIPVNPMSATLGALVIAIATEFSVILAGRYESERVAGHSIGEALRRAYARTGTAVLASGVTAIAGFAALAATDIRMLRDFGLVTVADLGVALVGVLLVLPAVLVWAEQGLGVPARNGVLARLAAPFAARSEG